MSTGLSTGRRIIKTAEVEVENVKKETDVSRFLTFLTFCSLMRIYEI